VVADPKTKPEEDEFEDLEGDVHEEVPYETERLTRIRAHAGVHAHTPEWAYAPESARAQRRERNQFWSRVL
jgi:hypothetical protein